MNQDYRLRTKQIFEGVKKALDSSTNQKVKKLHLSTQRIEEPKNINENNVVLTPSGDWDELWTNARRSYTASLEVFFKGTHPQVDEIMDELEHLFNSRTYNKVFFKTIAIINNPSADKNLKNKTLTIECLIKPTTPPKKG